MWTLFFFYEIAPVTVDYGRVVSISKGNTAS